MTVVGFNLKKILIERKGLVRGGVNIKTSMNIISIKKESARITTGKDTLSFDFEFMIHYIGVANTKGSVADISFEGTVLYLADPKDTNQILDDWKKKEIKPELRLRVLNTILVKCNVKALVLEDDLGLPPHLPLPTFKPKQEKKKEKEEKKKEKKK